MKKYDLIKEIPITGLERLRIGNAQDQKAKTGVTVLLFDGGATVGVDISGGGPASRETPLTSPVTADNPINAIVLSGGSAYGLAASDGVMRYLEEHGIGYDTGFAKVPLVCQSCIYDLGIGSATVRPDAKMGYAACVDAEQYPSGDLSGGDADSCQNKGQTGLSGSLGAGTGATVGKICGMERATKTGLGVCAFSLGELKIAAVVVLNALGDVFDPESGDKIAGLRSADGEGFADICEELYRLAQPTDLFTGNTTIGAIVTNGKFSKAELTKIASMTRNAYARCIRPVGTLADGDTIYAASVGDVPADINVTGTFAAEVMAEAIRRAASCMRDFDSSGVQTR
ncbi:MAG: P1 family peptidase [Clostridiales bacterium]|nr:P1 family peptidase [Clostridiales bacterium]